MDFRNIFKAEVHNFPEMFATPENLRQHLYIQLSNSHQLRERCLALKNTFKTLAKRMIIRVDEQNKDILEVLMNLPAEFNESEWKCVPLKSVEYIHMCDPLFAEVKLLYNSDLEKKRNIVACVNDIRRIGYQHILLTTEQGSNIYTSEDSSDNLDDSDNSNLSSISAVTKKRRTCQKENTIDLKGHDENCSVDKNKNFVVDILIYLDSNKTDALVNQMGLVAFEELVKGETNPAARAFNADAKIYKLAQRILNKKLIAGYNNVVVTKDMKVWSTVRANVKAIIVTGQLQALEFGGKKNMTNYFIICDDSLLSMIDAVGQIIGRALHCNLGMHMKYEVSSGIYSMVNMPITTIIPLYIMRFFIQSQFVRNMISLDDIKFVETSAGDSN